MKELQSVVLTGLGAITARGDITLHGNSTPRGDSTLQGEVAPARAGAGAIEGFALETYLDSQKTYLDRCSALALAGSALALRDAGIEWPVAEERFGITLGTHLGCLETMKGFWDKATEKGVRLANALLFSHSYFNSPISLCAIEFGLKGYHTTLCAGHESGLEAVRAGYDAIRLGHANAMLCGGVEALTPARELCEPSEAGLGEAAVFFVLESELHAGRRSAPAHHLELTGDFFVMTSQERREAMHDFGDAGGAVSALILMPRLQSVGQS
jgi:3-oxoacyl-[acyl-carrier-protein] synthase II